MDLFYKIWNNNNKVGNGPWSISGNSIAGIRTAFQIPELKIQLDAGLQSFNKVSEIFITHSHADHISSLPLIILEKDQGFTIGSKRLIRTMQKTIINSVYIRVAFGVIKSQHIVSNLITGTYLTIVCCVVVAY